MKRSVIVTMSIMILFSICFAQPTIEWQKCLGGSSWDEAESIQQTFDGGFIVAGWTKSDDGDVSGYHGCGGGGCTLRGDYWVVNLETEGLGSIAWQKCLGGSLGEGAYSIQQTSDGGFIVAGHSYSNDDDVSGHHGSTDDEDWWVVKLDVVGSIEWQRSLGGSERDWAYSIQETSDGGFIVAGWVSSNDGDVSGLHGLPAYDGDCWVVKLNAVGSIEWQKCFGGTSGDNATSIQQTSDGGYIVAGLSCSNDGDVTGHHGSADCADYWVVKLNSAGDIIWQKSLGGSGHDYPYSIQQTSDGGYVVAGYSNSEDGDVTGNHGYYDYWVVKLDSSGTLEWQKSLGGGSNDIGKSMLQTSDGGYIIAGMSNSDDGDVTGNHGGSDYWVVKLNSSGDIVWQKCLGGSDDDFARSIQQTFDGGYIIAGTSNSDDGDVSGHHGIAGDYSAKDYWVVKLSPETGISEHFTPQKLAISVSPNPFNSAVTISAPEGAAIEIFDLNGRMVDNNPVGDGFPVPSANGRGDLAPTNVLWQPDASLGSGVYLVRAKIGDKDITKRVVYLK